MPTSEVASSGRIPEPSEGSPSVLSKLEAVAGVRVQGPLSARLGELAQLVAGDLAEVEHALLAVRGASHVESAAQHLIALGGKRLRPMCVALAAHAGTGFGPIARELAVSVELVHSATLLHDDVVDLGELRRGAPTSRVLYGNAVSIFAGDWLLVEALRRVRRAGVPGTLDALLAILDEMILAESVQLENRGQLHVSREAYFRVCEGKTAALFRWAMQAGARAGELAEHQVRALERYGSHLGVAFQAIDDLLDVAGDAQTTGKALFADLREGKMTYPLIVALENDPSVRPVLLEVAAEVGDAPPSEAARARIAESIVRTDAIEACRALARAHAAEAVACLEAIPSGRARTALVTVAEATISRDR